MVIIEEKNIGIVGNVGHPLILSPWQEGKNNMEEKYWTDSYLSRWSGIKARRN